MTQDSMICTLDIQMGDEISYCLCKGSKRPKTLMLNSYLHKPLDRLYLHDYASPKEARQQLSQYFEFYNHQRPHQALDYQTPAEVYSTGTPIGSF